MIVHPHYPVGVCTACKQFVQTTFVLKSIYDDTNELLKKLFYNFEHRGREKQTSALSTQNEVFVIDDSDEDTECNDPGNRNEDMLDLNNDEDENGAASRKDLKNEQNTNNSILRNLLTHRIEKIYIKGKRKGDSKKGIHSSIDREIDVEMNCADLDNKNGDILYSIDDENETTPCGNYFQNKLNNVTSHKPLNRREEIVSQKGKQGSRKKTEQHCSFESETEDSVDTNCDISYNRNEDILDPINDANDENGATCVQNLENEEKFDNTTLYNLSNHREEKRKQQKRKGRKKKGKHSCSDSETEDELRNISSRRIVKPSSKSLQEQNYLCPFCRSQFSTPTELRQHSHKHKSLKKYLIKDLKISHDFRFFAKCRTTTTIFSKSKILHKCMFCKVESPIESFKDHIVSHFERGEFPCNKCDRVFRKLHHLNIHVRIKHLEGMTYHCKKCDKQFCKKYTYECHLLIHNKGQHELPLVCEVCGKRFANKIYLHRHSFQHTGYQSFWKYYRIHKCTRCLRTFPTADELRSHKLTLTKCQSLELHKKSSKVSKGSQPFSDVSRIWKCNLCPRAYTRPSSLYIHKYVGHGSKKVCELCGAKVYNLKVHMKIHGPKQDPIECQICQKKLASKVTLVKHLRVHTGERPYRCKYCDKRFKDVHSKCVHQRIHEGIKKHICPICSKGFLEKPYMQKHLRAVHK